MIEDAPPGVAAARAAGMSSVGLASAGRTAADLRDADAVVDSLHQLSPRILQDLIARRATNRGAGI